MASQSTSGTVDLYGDMFSYTTFVYLSGATGMFSPTTTVNPFSTSTTLSAKYPALSGVASVLDYYVTSDNKITVSYPAPSADGYFDVIVVNDAGYTKLTVGSYNTNYTIQYPYASGILVGTVPVVNNGIYFMDNTSMQFMSGEIITFVM